MAKERKWVRAYSRRVSLAATAPMPQLGHRMLPEGSGYCQVNGCGRSAKEEWLMPDTSITGNVMKARSADLPAPTRCVRYCGTHSPRNNAGRVHARTTKQQNERREQDRRTRDFKTAGRIETKLKACAHLAPPAFAGMWTEMSYAYINAHRDPGFMADRAVRLNNALVDYLDSLTDAERTLLALVHPLPTKETR